MNGEWQEQTSFFNVVCWGDLGENAATSLTKGARAIVTGRLEQRSWETAEGEKRSVVEVVADEVGPSLRWATAQIERTERSAGDGGSRAAATHQVQAQVPLQAPAPASPIPSTATKSRSDIHQLISSQEGPGDGQGKGSKTPPTPTWQGRQPRKYKKKTSPLVIDKVEYVDYKDVDLLRRFMSDRAKIRNTPRLGQQPSAAARHRQHDQDRA